jgi:hypothetical protein
MSRALPVILLTIGMVTAAIPHQLTLTKGDTFQYFIVKVQEIE